MNVFHCFCESLYKYAYTASKPPTLFGYLFVYLFVCLYFCLAHFTLLVYKFSIMVVENFQKYHWIQHTNAQPVVIMAKRNKLL